MQLVLFQRSTSLAEQTMSTYKEPAGMIPPHPLPPSLYTHTAVPTIFVPDTSKQHPFKPELNHVSKFPIGFCGCYACDQEDHFHSEKCPLKKMDNSISVNFSENYYA